jgi:hypothetical protein
VYEPKRPALLNDIEEPNWMNDNADKDFPTDVVTRNEIELPQCRCSNIDN